MKKWTRLVVIVCMSIGSLAAWGQATAEYGLAASKSAAATAATLDKLNRSSSAAIAAAGASASRATDAGAHKAAPVAKTVPQARRTSQVQAKPAPTDATTSKANAAPADATTKLQPSGISLSRGSAATQRARDNKYPDIVDLGSSTNSSEKVPKAPPKQLQP